MATGLQLEQYLDDEDRENVAPGRILPELDVLTLPRSLRSAYKGLENLPSELQKNFHNMRDLDQQTQSLVKSVDKSSDEYLRDVCNLSPASRTDTIEQIMEMFGQAKGLTDEKVQLAVQTYELVDKHIRRLDSDLAKFEAEMKDKPILPGKKDEEIATKKKGRKKKEEGVATKAAANKKKRRGGGVASEEEETVMKVVAAVGRKKKKGKNDELQHHITGVLPGLSSIVHPSEAMDMPVDPNEPTYCLCHQVSYGEMIACDRSDCPIEWFHFACVNLTTKPKGKWYCPRCSSDLKKKK